MQTTISRYIPEASVTKVLELIERDHLVVLIKSERKTRHGDYRELPNGKHQITVNGSLNKYKFLITLIHEIAHLEAFMQYGKAIKPHGLEWKHTFKYLMLPFLNPLVFPLELLPLLANHFKNPKASSDTDYKLAYALKQFDAPSNKTYIFEVSLGETFLFKEEKIFKRGKKRTKRYECTEIETGKVYLFSPNAEVELLNK